MPVDSVGSDAPVAERNCAIPLPMPRSLAWPKLAFGAALVACVGLAIGVRVAFGPHVREDAFITLRYAENIAAGQGFVFNLGERVLGTTTPLFALLLAALARLGLDPAFAAIAIGILSDAGAMVILSLIAARFLKPLAVVFVLMLYALLSPIVSYAVSGMETSLYVLLILSSVLAYASGKMRFAGLLCALLVFTRPDGLILPTVFFFHALVYKRNGLLDALVVFVIVLAPWVAFATTYFGSPIPQSMIAKASVDFAPDSALSLRNFLWYFSDVDNRWFLPLSPVFILGILQLKRERAPALLMAWALAYSAAFIASNKFLFPLTPFEWYFVPLLAPFVLGIGAGLENVVSFIARLAGAARGWLYVGAAFTVGAVLLIGYGAVLRYQHSELGKAVGGRETVYAKLASQMAEMGVQDEPVAAYEIGAFAYRYPGPILDLWGLVSPKVVGIDSYNILYQARPPWIMTYADMLPDEVTNSTWFQREYKPVYALGTWEGRRATLFRRYSETTNAAEGAALGVLGESMELLKVDVKVQPLQPDREALHVTLVWKALRRIDQRYTVFTHLRDGSNRLIGQHDGEPQGNEHSTTLWQAGETVVDKHDLVVDNRRLGSDALLVVGAYKTGAVEQLLRWSKPTVPVWPHELRIRLSSLDVQR
ncbi:MAG: hypothetical protein M1343_13800 [Chloroflexi bacterium]|nr:hypothetical protein [Chloroflexota bacterium]MDA8187877.1 hypothetical protein [Dehalococcoidales bacterium]